MVPQSHLYVLFCYAIACILLTVMSSFQVALQLTNGDGVQWRYRGIAPNKVSITM